MLFKGFFALLENGQLEHETYSAYLAYFSGLVATPGGSRWWEEVGRPIFVGKMVAAVDASVAKGAFPEMLQEVYRMPEVADPR